MFYLWGDDKPEESIHLPGQVCLIMCVCGVFSCVLHACVCLCVCVACMCVHAYAYTLECLSMHVYTCMHGGCVI